jgi:flavin reductase (DIM6/NTAB) family NADH-FMN oxidoreductase RutF
VTRLDLDPAELGAAVYPWLTSVGVPCPIAWVSTRSATGVDNLASHSFFTVAGTDFPAAISEYDAAVRVSPVQVAESPVALECVLVGTQEFGICTVVFGEAMHLAVSADVLRDGRPEVTLLKQVARLGAEEWSTLGEISSRRRIPFSELA